MPRLSAEGALVLKGFFTPEAIERIVTESAHREQDAFLASSSHNVYLTPIAPDLAPEHPFNRQVESSRGGSCTRLEQ